MRIITLVLLLVLLGAPSTVAQETDDPDAESKIVALEHVAKLQACRAKDIKTLDVIFDDALIDVDPQGRVRSKAELLLYVQTAGWLQYSLEGLTVRLHGNTAVVTGLYTLKGTVRGEPFLQRGRFVDTWLQKDRRWVAVASLATPNP